MSATVRIERTGRTATATIDRPPLNVLDVATIDALRSGLDELGADPGLQLVVLRSAGEKAFSAGVALEDHTPDKVPQMLDSFHGLVRLLRRLPAITLARVQGHCLGGGMELATACDLVLAADDATFAVPEVQLACFPPVAAAHYPSRIGHGRTLDLVLTGRPLAAGEAEAWGLVTWTASADGLDARLAEIVASLEAMSAPVHRLIKKAVTAAGELGDDAALAEAERIYLEELTQIQDMEEGLTAFLEKRSPKWRHR